LPRQSAAITATPGNATAPPSRTATEEARVMRERLADPFFINPAGWINEARLSRINPPPFPGPVPNTVAPPGNPPISPRQHREGMSIRPEPLPHVRPVERSLHPSTFTTLTPTDEQMGDMAEINMAAEQFAREIDRLVPPDGAQHQWIMNQLRQIAFWARETILRYPNGEPRAAPRYDPFLDCAAGAAGATVIPEPTASRTRSPWESVPRQP
jgi:hypothetical protein